jgi:hypothetical protein
MKRLFSKVAATFTAKLAAMLVAGGVWARIVHSALEGEQPPALPPLVKEMIEIGAPIVIAWLIQSPIVKKKK